MDLKENKVFKIITMIINIIFCLILPFSVIGAMVSPMAFDSPGSDKSLYTWIFFLSAFSIPVVILASVINSVSLLKSRLYRKALIFSLLPLINFIAILLVFSMGGSSQK
ncbi:hypothetical protein [Clostridium lundense]|uniref:hypothetical protein n=1 Tax=Clostridium lundense TaxID=319475 RepID=UPI000B0D35DF|nr:hypothetical protein [Clostridium lundense]